MQHARQLHGRLIAELFFATKMALQFDINICFAENIGEFRKECGRFFQPAGMESIREQPFISSGQANQAVTEFTCLVEVNRALAFFSAQFHATYKAAKISVANSRTDQQ